MFRSAKPCVAMSITLPEVSPGRLEGKVKLWVVPPCCTRRVWPPTNSWALVSAVISRNCTEPSPFEYSSLIENRWNEAEAGALASEASRSKAADRNRRNAGTSMGHLRRCKQFRRRNYSRLLLLVLERRLAVVDLVAPALQPRVAREEVRIERGLLEHVGRLEELRARLDHVEAPQSPRDRAVVDGARVEPLRIDGARRRVARGARSEEGDHEVRARRHAPPAERL